MTRRYEEEFENLFLTEKPKRGAMPPPLPTGAARPPQ